MTSTEGIIVFIFFFMSIVAHEVAHGWAAFKLGDPTAKLMDRLNFNPVKHIDPVMTIIVPAMLFISTQGRFMFGGAKPVPINPFNFKKPDRDMMLSSLAGPMTNVLLALFFTIPVIFLFNRNNIDSPSFRIFFTITGLNLFLAMFNMIPIPPLDGSRVLRWLMPDDIKNGMDRMEHAGMFIILAFIIIFKNQVFAIFDWVIKGYFSLVLPSLEII